MTVRELLIKFQEYQLEYKVLNANCAHNAAANLFMERYGVKNCSIPDVSGSLPSAENEKQVLQDYLDWYDNDIRTELPLRDGNAEISEYLIDKFVSGNDR